MAVTVDDVVGKVVKWQARLNVAEGQGWMTGQTKRMRAGRRTACDILPASSAWL